MDVQTQLVDGIIAENATELGRNSLDLSEVMEILFHSERIKYGVVLWTVADEFAHLLEMLVHIHPLDFNAPAGRLFFSRQDLKGGRLASTIHSE